MSPRFGAPIDWPRARLNENLLIRELTDFPKIHTFKKVPAQRDAIGENPQKCPL
jgi:hypothetical protein